MAALKKPRTPAQQANDQRLRNQAALRRASAAAPEVPPPGTSSEYVEELLVAANVPPVPRPADQGYVEQPIRRPSPQNPHLVSAEQVFMAENLGRQATTRLALDTSDTAADRAKTEGTVDDKVRMWKPTAAGYRVRSVPTGLIMLNLKNGWKTACPHCGTDCGNDPNDCTAFPPAPVVYCPKAGCTHKINLRNLAVDISTGEAAAKDPNAVDLGYGKSDEMALLRAAMDQHIITRHPQEARILIGIRPDEKRLVIN